VEFELNEDIQGILTVVSCELCLKKPSWAARAQEYRLYALATPRRDSAVHLSMASVSFTADFLGPIRTTTSYLVIVTNCSEEVRPHPALRTLKRATSAMTSTPPQMVLMAIAEG
jgi:hypothetical protein